MEDTLSMVDKFLHDWSVTATSNDVLAVSLILVSTMEHVPGLADNEGAQYALFKHVMGNHVGMAAPAINDALAALIALFPDA